jgi:HAD superfamily phosphatase (TIGR01668 family)
MRNFKMFGEKLQPDLVLGETVLGVTPELIKHHRLQGLILDVDETLVPIREASTTPEVQHWFTALKQQVPVWLVSNNVNEPRIRGIAESLGAPYLVGAGKPSRRKLRQAAEAMQLPIEQTAMVGDRLFTDVLAGNRLGMFTILVEPMVYPMGKPGKYLIRSAEVWISQLLGVSFPTAP